MVEPRAQPDRALAWRALLYALAVAFGLLHARDLQIPPLSTARIAAITAVATAPALIALRARRRLALLALVPATFVAALLASGGWPSAAAPRGGLTGQLADAPWAWVQVVLPFAADEHPELRPAVLLALFAWLSALAWVCLARPRPLAAALLAGAPFVLSATVYELPQYPWRALLAGGLALAFLCTGRAAGGGRAIAAAFGLVGLAGGMAVAAVPAASRPGVLPWTTWTFAHAGDDASAVDLVWDMRYQPLSFGGGPSRYWCARGAAPAAIVLSNFDGLRFLRAPQPIVASRENRGVSAWRDRSRGSCAPRCRSRLRWIRLVAPGSRGFRLRPRPAVDLSADGSARLRSRQPAPGLGYVAGR